MGLVGSVGGPDVFHVPVRLAFDEGLGVSAGPVSHDSFGFSPLVSPSSRDVPVQGGGRYIPGIPDEQVLQKAAIAPPGTWVNCGPKEGSAAIVSSQGKQGGHRGSGQPAHRHSHLPVHRHRRLHQALGGRCPGHASCVGPPRRVTQAGHRGEGGYVFKTVGDAFCASSQLPPMLWKPPWRSSVGSFLANGSERGLLRVRMALHTGAAEERDGDYFGPPVNRVARLLSAAHGGQVLLSLPAQELVRDQLPAGTSFRDLGEHRLKDLFRPERVFQLSLLSCLWSSRP